MEIDQEGRPEEGILKITKEDQASQEDDPLLCEIKHRKEGIYTQGELIGDGIFIKLKKDLFKKSILLKLKQLWSKN